jgi:hypothetical protein
MIIVAITQEINIFNLKALFLYIKLFNIKNTIIVLIITKKKIVDVIRNVLNIPYSLKYPRLIP